MPAFNSQIADRRILTHNLKCLSGAKEPKYLEHFISNEGKLTLVVRQTKKGACLSETRGNTRIDSDSKFSTNVCLTTWVTTEVK